MTFSSKHQQGLTFISICFILGLIAFFVMLALKIAPIYMNHNKVLDSMAGVESMENVEHMSKKEVLVNLHKRFGLNYVDHIQSDDITVVKRPRYVRVEIDYEQVEHIAGNLSVLVQFYESFEVGAEE